MSNDINKNTAENKWEEFKSKFKEKLGKAGLKLLDAMINNPMFAATFITSIAGIIGGGFKMANDRRQMEYRACIVKDDVSGEKFYVKHPLNNEEVLEIGSRMIDGEWKGAILEDMDLLRKDKKRKL